MKQRAPTACHSQKRILASQIIHGWYIYIYICSAPPKQKTKKTKKTEPWGLQDLQWVWFLWIFCFFLVFVFSKGPSPKSLQVFFVGSMIFLFSARDPPQRVSEYCCVFVCMKMYV